MKFSVYLYFLKQNNYSELNTLKFDFSTYIISFKLYEDVKTKTIREIVEFYEELFKIGFSMNFINLNIENYLHQENNNENLNKFDQLFFV